MKYTKKQLQEAIRYWTRRLNERTDQEMTDKEKQALTDYVKKNKDKLRKLKYGDYKSFSKEEKKAWAEISKEVLPKSKIGGEWIMKAVSAASKDDEKGVEKAISAGKKAEAEGAGPSAPGDGVKGEAAVPPKVEQAVTAEIDQAKPEDLGVKGSEEAAEKAATAKPIGVMNLWDRLRRLHNATRKNVRKKLAEFLPWAKEEQVEVENSCIGDDGNFALPEDGNMFITVKVKVDDTNRKGFKKFIGGIFGKAVNEGVFGDFFGGLWKGSKEAASKLKAGAKEGAQKAAETYKANLANVNEEMKKRVGVAAIQEYVRRFCGIELSKKVNYQNIQVAIENEGTESAAYVFTGCVNIKK